MHLIKTIQVTQLSYGEYRAGWAASSWCSCVPPARTLRCFMPVRITAAGEHKCAAAQKHRQHPKAGLGAFCQGATTAWRCQRIIREVAI
jgi:hypothetical protein